MARGQDVAPHHQGRLRKSLTRFAEAAAPRSAAGGRGYATEELGAGSDRPWHADALPSRMRAAIQPGRPHSHGPLRLSNGDMQRA